MHIVKHAAEAAFAAFYGEITIYGVKASFLPDKRLVSFNNALQVQVHKVWSYLSPWVNISSEIPAPNGSQNVICHN